MKLTVDAGPRTLFIRAIKAQREAEALRTGLHCSSIINDIVQANDPDLAKRKPMSERLAWSFQEMGNVIEDVLADVFAARFPGWEKPAPRIYEGVTCSPDGWAPRTKCIEEVKATWKGTKEFAGLRGSDGIARPFEQVVELVSEGETFGTFELEEMSPKLHGYLMQTMYYMVPWKAVRARLHIFFINGNYRPPFPEPVTLNLRPTEEEVQRNYQMIIRHARDRGMLK